jgi:hypothetical protein
MVQFWNIFPSSKDIKHQNRKVLLTKGKEYISNQQSVCHIYQIQRFSGIHHSCRYMFICSGSSLERIQQQILIATLTYLWSNLTAQVKLF